jgi:hypothetical protein
MRQIHGTAKHQRNVGGACFSLWWIGVNCWNELKNPRRNPALSGHLEMGTGSA